MKVEPGQTIVVWFSCGAASAVAAKKTIELYGKDCKIRIVNNPVKEEDQDNQRFLKDVEKWLGYEIEFATNPKFSSCSAVDVWNQKKYMAGNSGAPCTYQLKKQARQQWEEKNHYDWIVLGFTADEKKRYENFIKTERPNTLPVLIWENLTKADCFRFIEDAGINLPRIYHLGYPNANCIGCVKASSPTYWNHVRKVHPTIFQERADQSRILGAKLVRVNNKRIYLDQLPKNAKGRPLKNMNFECGIFCEEKL